MFLCLFSKKEKAFCFVVVCAGIALNAIASGSIGTNAANPSNGYVVTKRGLNSRVWSSVSARTNLSGKIFYRTNSFTEMATGMHYLQNGSWAQASSTIQLAPDGSAAYATNSQHQVGFAANLHVNGAIDLVMPGGRHLQSTVLGLIYHDISSGTNVVIANLQDSVGQLLPTQNQIVYTNALTDPGVFNADVLYTHRVNGFEQDIIIRQQPPAPEQFGLDSANTHLQVWTEFFAPPEPIISTNSRIVGTAANTREVLEDEKLNFGSMLMGRGNAFASSGATNNASIAANGMMLTPVAKHWVHFQGRTFLVEEVPFNAVAPQLSQLPASDSGGSNAPAGVGTGEQSFFRPLPPKELQAKLNGKRMQMASADLKKQPGFLLDYDLINASMTNFTFQSDTTYFLSGFCYFYGTTTIEGGAVMKCGNDNGCDTVMDGDVNWLTSQYHPAVFTCTNDDSVGVQIPGSSGVPDLSMATCCYVPNGGLMHDVRFCYCYNAYSADAADVEVSDCQFINCSKPITVNTDTTNLGLHNVLITESDAINQGQSWGPDFAITVYSSNPLTFSAEHVTADLQSHDFLWTWFGGHLGSVSLTNSIILASRLLWCTNCDTPSDPYDAAISTNAANYIASVNPGTLFQSVGGANYYLADNSPARRAGTLNISPNTMMDIQKKTTWPPVVYSNVSISDNLILSPVATRDTNADAVDIGYHYAPIDFAFGTVTTSTNLTVLATNGVALTFFGNGGASAYGLILGQDCAFVSQGAPTQPNYIVEYNTVQEQPYGNWGQPWLFGMLVPQYSDSTMPAIIDCRFTYFSSEANDVCFFDNAFTPYPAVNVQDSEFHGGFLSPMDGMTFTNCLLERVTSYLGDSAGDNGIIFLRNCLVYGGYFSPYLSNTNSLLMNNEFYNTTVSDASGCAYFSGYNAYYGTTNTYLFQTNGNDQFPSDDPGFQAGLLGYYYQPSGSPLIDKGSITADQLGLYHYTTETNQLKETNSTVDIGYHYVALDTNGLPVSTSGDGLGDYLKDSNGNGNNDPFVDIGNWLTNSTCTIGPGDYISYLQGRNLNICTTFSDTNGALSLKVYTPLK